MPVPVGTQVTIRLPDDFHHHARDGRMTETVIEHASERFGRCLMMPNLKPPITTTEQAMQYKQHILDCVERVARNEPFEPLMTLYLTDSTTADEIYKAATHNTIVGCKYYPAGATTNSDHGVTNITKCYPALRAMAELGLVLCIHSEVTHGDIFGREKQFIQEIMKPLVNDFPTLKITMEHISTEDAVNYILNEAPDTVKASITCHHLLYNRNDLLVGGIKPHLYCLPILKAAKHCSALCQAAISGNSKFFLGTDSAPHPTYAKESSCGCAGVYTAHAAIELYLEVFDEYDALDKVENFASTFGAQHYGLPLSTQTITLEKKSWTVPATYQFGDAATTVTPLRAGQEIQWQIVSRSP
jgi:dihydroorotase